MSSDNDEGYRIRGNAKIIPITIEQIKVYSTLFIFL